MKRIPDLLIYNITNLKNTKGKNVNIKQLISVTLFSSLIITSGLSYQALAADTENSAMEKNAAHHTGVYIGELLETFNSGGYTYVQLKTDQGSVWAAGPITKINKTDKISFISKAAMIDFYSKSLNRKFQKIYFVDAFIVNGVKVGTMPIDPHKKINKSQAAALKPFTKVKNGEDIAGILANKDKLAGKNVKVRGQVNKYTTNVMGKNWLHIRDKSSDQDIAVTSDANAKLGDVVVVEGRLILDKDFGYGYTYKTLIEDAKLTVE